MLMNCSRGWTLPANCHRIMQHVLRTRNSGDDKNHVVALTFVQLKSYRIPETAVHFEVFSLSGLEVVEMLAADEATPWLHRTA